MMFQKQASNLFPVFGHQPSALSRVVESQAGNDQVKELAAVEETENESKQTSRDTLSARLREEKPKALVEGEVPKFNSRASKLYSWLVKKHHKKAGFHYKRRAKVASRRLRIKGRFVTRDQAFQILGLTQDEIMSNDLIQGLLERKEAAFDTTILGKDGRKQIKINNLQALIAQNYSTAVDPHDQDLNSDNKELINLKIERETNAQEGPRVMCLNYEDYRSIINDKAICEKMKDIKVQTLVPPIWKIERIPR